MRSRFPVRSLIPLLCAALASPLAAGVNRWTPIGPPSGYVNVITAAPSRPATIYAGLSIGGIFRSLDHGQTWQATRFKIGSPVFDIAVDPQASQTVYATNPEGFYTSVDGGASWLGPFLVGTESPRIIEVHPRNTRVLFAVAAGKLFKSTNRGRTWKTDADWPEDIWTMAFDPARPATVYAVGSGAWRSDDGGTAWKQIVRGLPDDDLRALDIAIDPRFPETLYLVATSPSLSIFRSRDRGETWEQSDNGLGDRFLQKIAVDPVNSWVYLATFEGLLRSTDRGASWTPAGTGLGAAVPLELEATRQRLLVATSAGIFASTDRGVSLQPSNENLWASVTGGLAIDSQRPPALYASDVNGGVFKTRRRGPPWSRLSLEVEEPESDPDERLPVAVDPRNPSVVYAGISGRVAKSTDGREHWTLARALPCLSLTSIQVDPAEPSTLYVSGFFFTLGCYDEPDLCQSYRSLDGGETWTCLQDHSPSTIDPFTSTAYSLSRGDLYRSTDQGDTWTLVHAGLGATFLAASPVTSGTLWALGPGQTGRSTDGGRTWKLYRARGLDAKAFFRPVPDPVDPLRLYAVSLHDVFRSDDGGHTWARVGPGLEGLEVTDLVIDPVRPRILYAGTRGRGVMRIEQE